MTDNSHDEKSVEAERPPARIAREFVQSMDSEVIRRLYLRGPNAVYGYCVGWGVETVVMEGDLSRMAVHECVNVTAALARHAEAEIMALNGPCPRPALPETPLGLAIDLNVEWDSDPSAVGIDCPKRFPPTAKLVGAVGSAESPWDNPETWLYITTNRTRKHWILWGDNRQNLADSGEKGRPYVPLAWCETAGLTRETAACALLRAYWTEMRNSHEIAAHGYIMTDGVLSCDELTCLTDEIWPEQADNDPRGVPKRLDHERYLALLSQATMAARMSSEQEEEPEHMAAETGEATAIEAVIGGQQFQLELALDEWSRFQGLSGRESLDGDAAMLYVFPSPGRMSFVLRRCLFPIDLLLIAPNGRVDRMHRMTVEPMDKSEIELKQYPSDGPVQFSIEFASGTLDKLGLEPAQKIDLPFEDLVRRVR